MPGTLTKQIQTYYWVIGLPSCRWAVPASRPLPGCSSSPRVPSGSPLGPLLLQETLGAGPDNWRKCGCERSRASLFCLEGRIENAPGSASCENSLGGRGDARWKDIILREAAQITQGEKGCFDCCWLFLSAFLSLSPPPTLFFFPSPGQR